MTENKRLDKYEIAAALQEIAALLELKGGKDRFNQAASSPRFDDTNAFKKRDGSGRYFGRPTASFDPRQFQFGVKLNF